jgi:hypothetical protein
MKPVNIESSVGLDRLATRNEVRYAISFSSLDAFELVVTCDAFREMNSDFLPEDDMWSAIVSEMPTSKSN